MFGKKPEQTKVDLMSAVEVVLCGGSSLQAEGLTIAAGERGGCVVTGPGSSLTSIANRFADLEQFGAAHQPKLNAWLAVYKTSSGGRRGAVRHSRHTFTSVSALRQWYGDLGQCVMRWRVYLEP